MRVLRGENPSGLPRGAVATVGNYDGLHLGQRAVVDRVVERAGELGAAAVVVTFEPHPMAVIDPARAPRRISSDGQRERQLAAAGVDVLWVIPFTREFSRRSAEEFVTEFLHARLALRELIVGSRFQFGQGRRGNLGLLERMGRELGFSARGVPELTYDGEPVSSTRIRTALAAGNVELAGELLGRPCALEGSVVAGDRLGRGLGWPTANIAPLTDLYPANGVYATEFQVLGASRKWDGVTNVGVRPTRTGDGRLHVETYVLDFAGDLYGRRVEVSFLRRLRDERRFSSLEALAAQISADVEAAREYFVRRRRSLESAARGEAPDAAASIDASH